MDKIKKYRDSEQENTRECSFCNQVKNLNDFYSSKNGVISRRCKSCCAFLHTKNDTPEKRTKRQEHQKKYREQNREKLRDRDKKRYRKSIEKSILLTAKKRAKKHGVLFNLELCDIFVPKCCPVLGIELKMCDKNFDDCSPSLDKIIPSLGYVKGNVRVISWRANKLKSDGSLEEFKKIVNYLDNFSGIIQNRDVGAKAGERIGLNRKEPGPTNNKAEKTANKSNHRPNKSRLVKKQTD